MPRIAALVVAAGTGNRLGGEVPKQFRPLHGRPILRRALDALRTTLPGAALRVVIRPDARELYAAAIEGLDLPPPVAGGATRQESVRAGLEALAADPPDLVLIHDAARPFLDAATVQRVLAALETAPGAIAALPVVDTLRRVTDGRGAGTVPRDGLWAAQTPQGFRFDAILAAHRAAAEAALTDDAAVAEHAGLEVVMVEGSPDNFKITTEADLLRAERLLAPRPESEVRIGNGFDVHRFATDAAGGEAAAVILCGVPIPHPRRLTGHSDADVGLHALTDALLGAIAAGDIGQHFPPSDMRWKGADSSLFLHHAAGLVAARGYRIVNVDVTLLCEAPRIGPHREAMAARIAQILQIEADRVSVKATTTERLGFLGRAEGIAAQATASVDRRA